MQLLSLLSFLFTLSVGVYVGTRLLLVARRTRQLPELAFGLAGTSLNVGGLLDAFGPRLPDDASAVLCSVLAHTVYSFSAAVTWWGSWFLYRADQMSSKWLARVCIVLLSIVAVAVIVAGGYQDRSQQLRDHWVITFFWIGMAVRLGGYIWFATEAAVFFVMQRRGLKYGLTDPITTFQFLCWAISNGGMVVILTISAFTRFTTGFGPMHVPIGQLTFSVIGIVATFASWFAFFPPKWIVRRVTQGFDAQGTP